MNCPHLKLMLAIAVALLGSGAARAGEDIMPMIAGSYAYINPDETPAAFGKGAGLDLGPLFGMQLEPPAAGPQLHKNVIKLTLPAGANRAALDDELAAFVPEPSLSRALSDIDAPMAKTGLADIPGLMTPETLAALPSRNFHEDLKDLVSLDSPPAAPVFERFDSAAYIMPISTATYIAPAPEEFLPDMQPVASASLPQPGELILPMPLVADAMPPLPFLDPVARPRLPVDEYSSKTEALVRVPSLNVTRTPVTPPPAFAAPQPPSLRPPSGEYGEYFESFDNAEVDDWAAPPVLFGLTPAAATPAFASGVAPAVGDETPRLAGPLLGLKDKDPAPPLRTGAKSAKKRPSYEEPAVIGGVPVLAPGQFRGKHNPGDKALASPVVEEESGKGFDPFRPIRSLFGGKGK